MLKFELAQNDKHFNKRFATSEKAQIFTVTQIIFKIS